MKKIVLFILCYFLFQTSNAQKIDMVNAPRNPIGFKHKKEHFFLKGDIYASAGKIFDKAGNLIYNYGTRYYYDNARKIIGNNYSDVIAYDSRGNIVKFQYKNGGTNNYTFNNKNLLTFEKNTYGDDKTYTYDAQNRLVKTVLNRKGVFHQQRNYSYEKKGNTIIVSLQYINADRKPGFTGKYHYANGFLIKEELASGVYEYTVDTDSKGNKVDFYTANDPKAKHFKTYNRYYSDANKPIKLEYGYYIPGSDKTGKKLSAAYINNVRVTDIIISKGVNENEKIMYDGLTQTYYSIPNITEDTHTTTTRILATKVLSQGIPHISYAHDGKFINYIHGQNKAKAREFSFIGAHMVDYRVEKNTARTYIIYNYKNQKEKAVKKIELFPVDTTSILYARELTKDNFFIVVKGKHIDYKKARFEYLTNGDPVIFIDDKPLYVLTGFKAAIDKKVYVGAFYKDELNQEESNTSTTTQATTIEEKPNSDFNCAKGDCKEGWGRVKVNGIITDATFKDGAIDGVAYISYSNGSYFHGQYKNNRRHGVGYYKWENGNVYIGGWKEGKQHGLGYTMNTGNQITTGGLFENGKLITEATDAYRDEKKDGNCTGNCSDGFGKYTYNNGDTYWGFFKDGQRYGVGTYLWKNKSVYTGAYILGGKRQGYGIYTYVDGSVFKGMYANDRIDGLGVMKYKETGNIVQGVFNSKGAKIKEY